MRRLHGEARAYTVPLALTLLRCGSGLHLPLAPTLTRCGGAAPPLTLALTLTPTLTRWGDAAPALTPTRTLTLTPSRAPTLARTPAPTPDQVRLGPLFLNENLSGTCCEVAYLPCS